MRILVFSHHHLLLPFAWRLKREGAEVEAMAWAPRYSRAWEGRLPKAHPGKPTAEDLAPWIEAAQAGELAVLTDSNNAQEFFQGSPLLFGNGPTAPFSSLPTLLLGGWFTGENLLDPHWLVPDWGLWPGGLGAATLGSCTLLRTPSFPDLNPDYAAIMRANGYRGLVAIGMEYVEASNELSQVGFVTGWNPLFSHLFISGLENFHQVLEGGAPVTEGKQFVVALPVSMPPYPIKATKFPEPFQLHGITNDIARQCFFHDFMMKGSELWTAGLDGLVAVVRGSGNSFTAAQASALAVATALPIPQKQMRVDVGQRVPSILMGLEKLGYL